MIIEHNGIVKTLLPLIISIFTVSLLLLVSFIFSLHEYPLWINEGGIIESLSAIGYLVAALLIVFKGKLFYIKQYYYFFILIILFGLRELDFHKKFTTMGMFKSKFYLSDSVPLSEKFIGLLVIILVLYMFVTIIKKHSKGFFTKIKKISPVHIGLLITFFLLFFSKTIDGLARKLAKLNILIDEQTSIYFNVIEEVLELGIPLLIIATLIIYFRSER